MLGYLIAGCVLGLSAGLAPGPLMALLLAETLRGGVRCGAKVALAPLATDGPIVLAAFLVLSRLAEARPVLGAISLAGGAFVVFLGVGCLRARRADEGAGPKRGAFGKAVGVNFLSPHPYLFWLTVGGPQAIRAAENSLLHSGAFLVSFYAMLVGALLSAAVLAGRSRTFLKGPGYVWTMRALGAALLVLAALLFRDGVGLLMADAG